MRVFVTGASGFIGSAVVPELLRAGHQVVGLARSDESAVALTAAGAEVHRGSLDDLDSLRAGAEASDGVIHLAFVHDFTNFAASTDTDRRAIDTFGDALAGSDRPFVIASGTLGVAPGRIATEQDRNDDSNPRGVNANVTLALAERGVRSSIVRLSPTVHDLGDHGFIPRLIDIARDKGTSSYLGDGANRWCAVHREDAAVLFRLALEKAPAGSALHGVGEEGVAIRDVAAVVGKHLDLPVTSIPAEQAAQHFGWLAAFLALDAPASNDLTRELLGWQPTHRGLIEDLEEGDYFTPRS